MIFVDTNVFMYAVGQLRHFEAMPGTPATSRVVKGAA